MKNCSTCKHSRELALFKTTYMIFCDNPNAKKYNPTNYKGNNMVLRDHKCEYWKNKKVLDKR